MKKLRLLLGDQLNHRHPWFDTVDDQVVYVLMEIRQETDYVRHHIQKVLAFFLAMRSFAAQLKEAGHHVHYLTLDDPTNEQDLGRNLQKIINELAISEWAYQEPDEYRLDQQLLDIGHALDIPFSMVSTDHFFTQRGELASLFKGKKTYLMETFYRYMRKKWGILMEGTEPVGGQWNYDAENRHKLPATHRPLSPKLFSKPVDDLLQLLEDQGVKTMGHLPKEGFIWPTTRAESLELLQYFVENALIHFGRYEDAMSKKDWSVYHSRLSFALNCKLLSPKEVIDTAVQYWEKNQNLITLPQIEGFVRQILGWREFMRGIYWAHMPSYATLNALDHHTPLPDWFWTGETKMNCLRYSIGQSLEYAYAHHIQRLMVIGNFALLAGISPDELDAWYLGVYIDAIEWVEITNTRGMSQFADGGIVGSKPYVASSNYIQKMGDYCQGCHYDMKQRTGEKACPFNALYWDFYARHEDRFRKNPRIGMMYQTWGKMSPETQASIRKQAADWIARLNEL